MSASDKGEPRLEGMAFHKRENGNQNISENNNKKLKKIKKRTQRLWHDGKERSQEKKPKLTHWIKKKTEMKILT